MLVWAAKKNTLFVIYSYFKKQRLCSVNKGPGYKISSSHIFYFFKEFDNASFITFVCVKIITPSKYHNNSQNLYGLRKRQL